MLHCNLDQAYELYFISKTKQEMKSRDTISRKSVFSKYCWNPHKSKPERFKLYLLGMLHIWKNFKTVSYSFFTSWFDFFCTQSWSSSLKKEQTNTLILLHCNLNRGTWVVFCFQTKHVTIETNSRDTISRKSIFSEYCWNPHKRKSKHLKLYLLGMLHIWKHFKTVSRKSRFISHKLVSTIFALHVIFVTKFDAFLKHRYQDNLKNENMKTDQVQKKWLPIWTDGKNVFKIRERK